jgi:drug/metabolite transporter (DMT)-like permease
MKVLTKKFFKNLALAIVYSAVANVVFIFIVKLFVHPPSTFSPFMYPPIVMLTALGVFAAGIVYAIIKKFFKKYNTVFTWVAVVALLLSYIPDIQLYTSYPRDPDTVGITIPIVIILMITHTIAAYIAVTKLTAIDKQ